MKHLVLLFLASSYLAPAAPAQAPVISREKIYPAPQPTTSSTADPRTPIDVKNTPGDADSMFRITKPGSYYLTGNLLGQKAKSGIEIAANDVTIDLMGFALIGTQSSMNGITTDGTQKRIRIHDGTVDGFGERGIDLYHGWESVVERVIASNNGDHGIILAHYSRVAECMVRENGGYGIVVAGYSQVSSSRASINGSHGIVASTGSVVEECTSTGNQGHGFSMGNVALVVNCTSTANTEHGFAFGGSSNLRGCTATNNALNGFDGSTRARVEGCVSGSNGQFGIHVKHQSQVRANNLVDNGGVGIGGGLHLEGTHSVAEDNLATDNEFRGYWVEDASNFLRRNTAGGSAINWQVTAGNFLRVLDATPNGGIFGDVGGNAVGPYDPNANYSL